MRRAPISSDVRVELFQHRAKAWLRLATFSVVSFLLVFCSAFALARRGAVSVRDLIEVRDISSISAAPDGSLAVFRLDAPDIETNALHLSWYLVRADEEGSPTRLADAGDPIWNESGVLTSGIPEWSPDSIWVYFCALHAESVQVWRANTRTGVVEQVTDDDADVDAYVLDRNGQRLVYAVRTTRQGIKDAEQEAYQEGVVLDPTVQVHTTLLKNFPYHGRMATIRRDLAHGFFVIRGDVPATLKEIDLRTRRTRVLDESEQSFSQIVHGARDWDNPETRGSDTSPDGTKVAYYKKSTSQPADAWAKPPAQYRLEWSSLSGPSHTVPCPNDACLSTVPSRFPLAARWASPGSQLEFVSQDPAGTSTLHVWDINQNIVRDVMRFSGLIGAGGGVDRYYSVACPIVGRWALCTTQSSAEPPRLERVELDTGKRSIIFDPNARLREKMPVIPPQQLTWRDKWGRTSTGVLVLPSLKSTTDPRPPLVITSYRCAGFLRGGIGADVPELALASVGFAVLCTNFDSDETWKSHPDSAVRTGQQSNLQTMLDKWESAVDFLAKEGLVDPNRVGISGLSFGAESVLYALTHSSKFAVAAAGHDGFADPANYYNLAAAGELGKAALEAYNLPPPTCDTLAVWASMSPALNASKIVAPLLIQTDEDEFRFGLQFYATMKATSKRLELVVFPEEGHQFMQPMHSYVRNARYVDWFRFWLQGWRDPDLRKQSQYARWGALQANGPSRITEASPR